MSNNRINLHEIPIVSSIDKNYVSIYSAFLASAISHINTNRNYKFILLVDDVPDYMIFALQKQVMHLSNVSLDVINMNNVIIKSNSENIIDFPRAASFRLYTPKLFPQYEKIIYIDADVIVMHDLAELFDVVLDKYAAVVLDYVINGQINTKKYKTLFVNNYCNAETYYIKYCGLNQRLLNKYFNSGVMLLNLNRLRKENIMSRCLIMLQDKKFAYPDQDILNVLFNGEVLILPQEWNFIPCSRTDYHFSYEITKQRVHAISCLKVIHFAGNKPWEYHKNIQFEELFWLFARKSVYYEKLLENKNNKIYKYLWILKNNFLLKLIKIKFPSLYLIVKKMYKKIKA
ncbi:glycosyltransferase family 8 protein [Desulfovibrio sp. An276]|uniref:glycosyltransferase family 8 protein n=1 Tax=Desulfovibrio sp. An276 TaxID=1965618 RepID=UPI0013A6109F|nr:glycosyltransferase family 8 protein [Desulfovibrio sp. An276]